MNRVATRSRATKETTIDIAINLDGMSSMSVSEFVAWKHKMDIMEKFVR